MTERQFIDLLRQYVAARRRTHKSYADMVQYIVGARLDASLKGVKDDTARSIEVVRVRSIAMREYGASDDALTFDTVG